MYNVNKKCFYKKGEETMFIKFNSEEVYFNSDYYYTNYKTLYRTICSHIDALNYYIEMDNSPFYIYTSANRLLTQTFMFDGYIDCLFDLRVISEVEYNAFYEFTKIIREECAIIEGRCCNG